METQPAKQWNRPLGVRQVDTEILERSLSESLPFVVGQGALPDRLGWRVARLAANLRPLFISAGRTSAALPKAKEDLALKQFFEAQFSLSVRSHTCARERLMSPLVPVAPCCPIVVSKTAPQRFAAQTRSCGRSYRRSPAIHHAAPFLRRPASSLPAGYPSSGTCTPHRRQAASFQERPTVPASSASASPACQLSPPLRHVDAAYYYSSGHVLNRIKADWSRRHAPSLRIRALRSGKRVLSAVPGRQACSPAGRPRPGREDRSAVPALRPQASGSSRARRPRRARGGLRRRADQRDELLGSRRGAGYVEPQGRQRRARPHRRRMAGGRHSGARRPAGELTGGFRYRPVAVPTYVTNRSRGPGLPRAGYPAAQLSRRRIAAC